MNPLEDMVKQIAKSAFAGLFDPRPLVFKPADESGIRPVRTGCKKPDGTLHQFRGQLNRNAFLRGCQDFTAEAVVEHLIVGFGFIHGSTTVVEQMAHVVGNEGAVSISSHLASAIDVFVKREHTNEVILFHNHPRNPINVVLNNGPLPSLTDRRTLMSFHRDVAVLGKALVGGGRVRFYLGENWQVQEFHTPDLLTLLSPALTTAGHRT